MNHRELIQCSEISNSVIRQNESLPAGIVLNTALVDRKGVAEDTVQTNVYFLQADFAKRFPDCLIVSVTADSRDHTMFLEAIKKTGSENYKFSRVQEKMEHYDKIWGPLMPDFYKRFGDYSQRRKQCMEATLDFFRRRYDFIIPVIESWKP